MKKEDIPIGHCSYGFDVNHPRGIHGNSSKTKNEDKSIGHCSCGLDVNHPRVSHGDSMKKEDKPTGHCSQGSDANLTMSEARTKGSPFLCSWLSPSSANKHSSNGTTGNRAFTSDSLRVRALESAK